MTSLYFLFVYAGQEVRKHRNRQCGQVDHAVSTRFSIWENQQETGETIHVVSSSGYLFWPQHVYHDFHWLLVATKLLTAKLYSLYAKESESEILKRLVSEIVERSELESDILPPTLQPCSGGKIASFVWENLPRKFNLLLMTPDICYCALWETSGNGVYKRFLNKGPPSNHHGPRKFSYTAVSIAKYLNFQTKKSPLMMPQTSKNWPFEHWGHFFLFFDCFAIKGSFSLENL